METNERRLLLYLGRMFPSVSVRQYPARFNKDYQLPPEASEELLVLLRRMENFAPGPCDTLQTYAPCLETAIIVCCKDDSSRARVYALLQKLRTVMESFILPLPAFGSAVIPGQWETNVVKEEFLLEEDGVWIFGTSYDTQFKSTFPVTPLPPYAKAHSLEGASI